MASFLLPALFIIASLFTITSTTKVSQCRDTRLPPQSDNDIIISDCTQPPCVFKRNTSPTISIIFKAKEDVDGVVTAATAFILGVPFPFIGVDGTSACPNIYSQDGKTKVGCPLKAGQTYQYKNGFKILELYPKIRVTIHWALMSNTTRDKLLCFEVPAKIG